MAFSPDYEKAILEEKKARIASKNSLAAFVQYMTASDMDPLVPAAHHKVICRELERCVRGPSDQRTRRLMLMAPPGSAKPVHEDEWVLEKTRGRVRLREIIEGDSVLTHKGRFRRVLQVHQQGELPVLSIKTYRGRTVRAAPDHPFLTATGWKEAKDLVVGDVLASVSPQENCGTETCTLEEARLLGYLVGDGSCGNSGAVGVATASEEISADVIHCAESLGFFPRRTKHKSNASKAWGIMIRSTPGQMGARRRGEYGVVRQWMVKHDLWEKSSYTKGIPPAILAGTPEIVANFLGAYWSCDGCIAPKHKGVHVGYGTVSQELAFGIQHLLCRIGVAVRVSRRDYQLRDGSCSPKRKNRDYTFYRAGATDQDNVAKFVERIPMAHPKRLNALWIQRNDFDRPLEPDRVISVDPAGTGPCRCLTVEEDSSFTANDIAVHNSTYSSQYFIAWYLGHNPHHRVISVSHTTRFSTKIGGKVRNIFRNPRYQNVFPNVKLMEDDQGKGSWSIDHYGGTYTAVSVGGGISGERAELIVIDDPFPSQEKANSDTYRDDVWTFYVGDLERRLTKLSYPVILINTRFHVDDLSGRLLSRDKDQSDRSYVWKQVLFEAICERPEICPLGRKRGEVLWPDWQPMKDMEKIRNDPGQKWMWASQYQQRPTIEGGNVLRRDDWKVWRGNLCKDPNGRTYVDTKNPRNIEGIVYSLDTAARAKDGNSYSAVTVWGMFRPPDPEPLRWADVIKKIRFGRDSAKKVAVRFRLTPSDIKKIREGEDVPEPRRRDGFDLNMPWIDDAEKPMSCILLDAWKERLTFPELRRQVKDDYDEWEEMAKDNSMPLYFLIENKQAGQGVIEELMEMGIHPDEVQTSGDKELRTNMVSPILDSGCVYALGAPCDEKGVLLDAEDIRKRRKKVHHRSDTEFERTVAELVVSECEKFPQDGKDITDTCTQAWKFMRDMGCFRLELDEEVEPRDDDAEPLTEAIYG